MFLHSANIESSEFSLNSRRSGTASPAEKLPDAARIEHENAASENNLTPSADAVEIRGSSSLFVEIQSRIEINHISGTYRPGSEVFPPALDSEPNRESLVRNDRLKLSHMRSEISGNLIRHFGTGSPIINNFDKTADWVMSTDPDIYQGLLVLMKMLSEDNPELAEKILSNFNTMKDAFRSSMNEHTANSVSVMMFNFEASITASNTVNSNSTELSESNLSININIETGRITIEENQAQMSDPLILDIDGDGIDLRSAEEGAEFDITGTGVKCKTAFIRNDDALLFIDKNNNNIADSGLELFGDQEGDAHGFTKLSKYDDNHDGVIDKEDEIYHKLRLFQDKNGDGINQQNETKTLSDLTIKSLILSHTETSDKDKGGNIFTQKSIFEKEDGSRNMLADVMLRYYKA